MGSFVIDLYHMNDVILTQEDMSVVVEGGAYLEEIDKAASTVSLRMSCRDVFHGCGRIGPWRWFWMSHLFGLSVDNLLECEAVLHDGTVVVANKEGPYTVQSFFWGLRGGSGNFGIVTKFAFRVHHIPMLAGYVVYPTPTVRSATE